MAKAWVSTHTLKTVIYFLLAYYTQTPLHEVVVEYALVELMEDIRCDTHKDVGEGKVFPKRFVDWAQTFYIKLL